MNFKAVNRILVSNEFRLEEPFTVTLQQQFGATAENMNFSLPGNEDTINRQIEESTNNKIKNLLLRGLCVHNKLVYKLVILFIKLSF